MEGTPIEGLRQAVFLFRGPTRLIPLGRPA